MIKETHVPWRHGCYCLRAGSEAKLNACHWKQSGEKLSNPVTSHHIWKKYLIVSLNSIWQLADLDRRKRITVWNELHATLTYPWWLRIRARWRDKAVQTIAPWTQLRRLFCFISLGPRHSHYPRGAACERTSLPAVCRAASCPYLYWHHPI